MAHRPKNRATVAGTCGYLVLLACLVGCSGSSGSTGTGDNGVGGDLQVGGTPSTQGGASSATGSTNAIGGGKANGGSNAAGGPGATGGVNSTGGSPSAGGITSVAIGGTKATGGVANTGGSPATGGALSGGGSGTTGGTTSTGGAKAMGGTSAAGGTNLAGSKATGGATATGGTPATGGTKATGGASTTGATAATGGTKATGGTNSTGGTKATGGASSTSFSICSSAPPAGTRVVSIYVIGDSTASIYTNDLYPRMGWGQVLGDYFSTACAVVKDKALSGRSSKSFYDEGAWTPIRNGLAAGDFVLIQFGHNDEKTDATLHTDPQTTYKQYLTTYVNDTKAKQAYPILLTSIARNQWSGTTLSDTHGAYPPAVRELAASLSVPLVDMTALTTTFLQRIGQTAATNTVFMDLAAGAFPNYPNGNTDNTHLQETGARDVARLFTNDAYRQKLPVAANLNAVPVPP